LDLDDISEEEKQDALAACDVLCVPSEGESFGMVYYEAWAYKKPVVALDLPVLRESIGTIEGGILTDQQPESIAKALVNLLENAELRSRLGNNGFELAQKHDWPLALNSYMVAYRHAGVEI
jgi:glycosyltransferase involved in cell wall biosynthesis